MPNILPPFLTGTLGPTLSVYYYSIPFVSEVGYKAPAWPVTGIGSGCDQSLANEHQPEPSAGISGTTFHR